MKTICAKLTSSSSPATSWWVARNVIAIVFHMWVLTHWGNDIHVVSHTSIFLKNIKSFKGKRKHQSALYVCKAKYCFMNHVLVCLILLLLFLTKGPRDRGLREGEGRKWGLSPTTPPCVCLWCCHYLGMHTYPCLPPFIFPS